MKRQKAVLVSSGFIVILLQFMCCNPSKDDPREDKNAQWWAACNARDSKKQTNLTDEDAAFIRASREKYVDTTGRCPPPGYGQWLHYAREQHCELHDYRFIERDLLPFRHYYAGRADLFKRLQALMAAMTTSLSNQRLFHLEYGVIQDGAVKAQTLPGAYLKFISDAISFLPDEIGRAHV
jgi:hypothetical protein